MTLENVSIIKPQIDMYIMYQQTSVFFITSATMIQSCHPMGYPTKFVIALFADSLSFYQRDYFNLISTC